MSVSFLIIAHSSEPQQGFKSPFSRDNLHKQLPEVYSGCLGEAAAKCQTAASARKQGRGNYIGVL